MNTAELQRLIDAIKTTLPLVIKEWNDHSLSQFEALYRQPFKQYFRDRQTQEKTKLLSPILNAIFAEQMKNAIPEFKIDEGNGRDYSYGVFPLESKITLGSGIGWVGNGYEKTPWHLLMRFDQSDSGIITEQFAMIVDLSQCISKWTKPALSSNFSGLKFLSEDEDKIYTIVGKISNKTPTGRKATYLTPIME